MKIFLSIILGFSMTLALAQNDGINDKLGSALTSGNYKGLAQNFSSNVEVSIDGVGKVYSKVQAELVLKDFFKKNQPKTFKSLHQGTSKSGISYLMGQLNTSTGPFQVSTYYKGNSINRIILNAD